MILAICFTHPSCIGRFESQLEKLGMYGPGHGRMRHALLLASHEAPDDPAEFRTRMQDAAGDDLEKLLALAHVRTAPPVRNSDDTGLAMMCLAEELARLEARRGARSEIEDAVEDMSGLADEGLTWRLSQAAEARHRADRSKLDDAQGIGEDRAAMSAQLQKLIDAAAWVKKKT